MFTLRKTIAAHVHLFDRAVVFVNVRGCVYGMCSRGSSHRCRARLAKRSLKKRTEPQQAARAHATPRLPLLYKFRTAATNHSLPPHRDSLWCTNSGWQQPLTALISTPMCKTQQVWITTGMPNRSTRWSTSYSSKHCFPIIETKRSRF